MKKIMLLDAYSSRTLACVRSFGAHGIPFVVGGHTRWDMSLYSRHCRESFVYESPYNNVSRFIEDINRNIELFGVDQVFPNSEAGIMASDMHRSEIKAELLAPCKRQIEILFQKKKTLAIAESVGVAIPRTQFIRAGNDDDLRNIDIPFPAIIKQNFSESFDGNRFISGGRTMYVYSKSELVEKAAKRLKTASEILVQEFINGYGVGISGIFKDGEPMVLFGHRRIRESNPLGGPSAVALSIPVNGELYNATVNIMRNTGHTGPAMVEYKIDRASATPYFMEINGRFWGSILLPLAAGLDIPYLFWKVINGISIDQNETTYTEGLIGRNVLADTKNLALVLKGRPKKWQGYFPGRWDAVRDYCALFYSQNCPPLFLTRDDPKPAYARLLQELLS